MNITNLLNIKHFLNTSSYFTNHLSKSLRVIVNISVITSLVLAQSLTASNLPSGGKFINGTGSIATNGNIMNITGDKTHNVIAWGGGFNIGKDNTVNFTTNGKNYLNLDYTNKASQILGTLNGGTNNVYIVNPSGVLVGEGATINANKFGVSTTPMGIDAINTFSVDGSFSPVFNANKGDVVNMGTIKANEIVLVGNKVENIKGTLQADKVDIKGDKVYLEDFGINSTHLKAEIGSEGFFKYEVKDVYDAYKDDSNLVDNYEFTGTATTNGNFKEYLYIGSQSASNEEMINSWKGFAKLVNEGIFGELKFKDVYLGKDIDFAGASTINPVGFGNGFVGNFYGNNHTLSNIQIDVADKTYVGLFGYIKGGSVQNLTIGGLQFPKYAFSYKYLGGLAGHIENGTFNNISLKNLGNIGVAKYAGGFTGYAGAGTYKNIILNNIGEISANGTASLDEKSIYAGGFAGRIKSDGINFSNIVLNDIDKISASIAAGGFVGNIENGSNIANSNIYFYGLLNSSSNKNYITHNENILNLSNTTDFQTFINQSKIAGLEYLTNTSTSNSHLHMINGGKIGNEKSKIIFDKDNFTYNTPKISEVDPDGSGSSSSPTAPNEGELSSITLEQSDFEDEILKTIIDEILNEDYVLNIDSIDFNKFNEGDVAILLYLLKNTSDKKLKESLKQSLEFYTEFNKGGLKTEFEKWYGSDESTYKTSMGKYNYIIESLANLKEYVNTILKPELKSIKNNLNRLEFLKAEIKRLERVYQKAMQNDLLPYDQLEVVYKNTQEKIDAYYAEAQGLLDILKNKNKPFLDDLITKEYSFEDKYTDIQGTFAIAGSSIDANAIENLADKPILSLPENENSGDSQTTNNTDSTDIVNTFSKQVKLTSTESILILPAEETQSHIKEDERERGRVCITSDNAKTNNPCIAITF
ncbi:TPA: filamentous hemagglutinin N-terminal domain-containing protein [Campylobacter coli]|nr:filamentous hemagglutinin N-terminal domain-containing protein [Campylobacter coli]HEF9909387.1 filamentous hemagglutinin N-terminal domain-containing protein [Campylobacter coli]HEF9943090.1 filamentous hemagglutinin N-terminal domain-containing protein [Campylobacter coli]